MADNLIEKFTASDFNHEKYVRELSQECVGGEELQQQRKVIQSLSESTNILLKKNVYKNYMQFIETAKEITNLESEMYQLSHLLSEQKSLLDILANSNTLNDSSVSEIQDESDKKKEEDEKKKQKDEEDRVRVLTAILEKVEGCGNLLEVKDRVLLHQGDILELDPVENTILNKTHAYLFSDVLMLTSWISNRRGPVKYKVYAMYNLNTMAVVNVRDLKPIEKAFKILAYPDTRLFQCLSSESKKEWLDCLDQAKKAKLTNEKVKRESTQQTQPAQEQSNLESPTSYYEDESIFSTINKPEWFLESPEEVDVLIAERHFEDALELLMKCKDYCDGIEEAEKDSVFTDIKSKLDSRKKNLTDVLMKELEVSPEKSLQGGLRAARRAVRLLIALQKTTQACEMMLKLCTSIVKKELKSVRREGATYLYIQQLGATFYRTLLDVVEEFQRVFPTTPASSACLVVWANSELTHFMSHVIKQIFVPQSSITTVAECVTSIRNQNSQLCRHGLDLRYQVDGMLIKPITIALQDARDKLIEAIKHRSSEEKWHPMNLQNKNNLNKLIQELNALGLTNSITYSRGRVEFLAKSIQKRLGDCWFDLTSNTVQFTKSFLTLVEDCLKLSSQQLHFLIEDVLYDICHVQLKMFQNAVRTHKQDPEAQLINKNVKFVMDEILTLVEKQFEKTTTIASAKFASLNSEFNHLKLGTVKPTPVPRSITKYSSEEFI